MRIFLDGQPLPINVRVSKDILLTLKSVAKTLHWKIWYDTNKEAVYISSQNIIIGEGAERLPTIEEPESNRLTGKVFCLDPGHGGSDPGAIGPTNTFEKDNTLEIALLLKDKLEANGAIVIMTRDTDKDVAFPDASSAEELSARVDLANEAKADLFISIHNDAFTSIIASGTTTFHYGDNESLELAKCVQKSLVENLGTKDRGVRFASFYVIRYTNMPAILIEAAFISNPEEEVLLSCTDGRLKTAEAIFSGIVKYFKV
ncbi:MAG: N-acetylmuramoyl-L-alanine amidase [Pelosinus sp.]|nr:N-acetylmuramoyl-L-alanine amidase [Pelosinus sp.]